MKHTVLFLLCIFGLFAYAACSGHQNNLPVLAHYQFDSDARDTTGRNPDCKLKNATFSGNALYLNGKYDLGDDPQGYHVACSTPSLDYNAFTVAVRFKCKKFDFNLSTILAGGDSGRWLVINRTEDKNLRMLIKRVAREDKDKRYRHMMDEIVASLSSDKEGEEWMKGFGSAFMTLSRAMQYTSELLPDRETVIKMYEEKLEEVRQAKKL